MFKDKAFKYVAPPSEVKIQKENPQYINHAQNARGKDNAPQQKTRVIVHKNQGDKRVAAAKSRPNKRKAVTPQDEDTLSMDSIQWSSTAYNVTSLVRVYAHQFPLLVKVTHGYDGDIGTPLAIGQVLQVHSCGRQQRILVADPQNRQLSMPVDYPIEVNVLQQNDRVWMKLRDVILSRTLPLRVRVMNTSQDAEVASRSIVGQDLHLQCLREDVFLRGNGINDGWIDQMDIAHLPSFMDAQFVVAENMRGATEEEWRDYHGMFSRSVRHLNFNLLSGYSGVYIEGAMPTPLLADGKPKTDSLKPLTKLQNEPSEDMYINIRSNEKKRNSNPIFYDNHSFSTADEHSPKFAPLSTPADIIPHFDNLEMDIIPHFDNHDTYKNVAEKEAEPKPQTSRNQLVVSPDIHQPARPETPFTDVDEFDVEEMFDNVIKVGQETLEKQRREEREQEAADAQRLKKENEKRLHEEEKRNKFQRERRMQEEDRRLEQERERKRMEKERLEAALQHDEKAREEEVFVDSEEEIRLRKEQEERERVARDALLRRERDEVKRRSVRERELRLSQAASMATPSLGAEIKLDENEVHYTSHIDAGVTRPRRSSTVTSDEVFDDKDTHRVLNMLNKFEGSSNSINNAGQKKSRPASRNGSRSGPRGSYISETSSGTPMGVIQPTVLQRKESLKENFNTNLAPHGGVVTRQSSIKTMDDVPDRTSGLTVEDICQCLKLLNMDVHIAEFRNNQVDGNTLTELRENSLMNEFHFTPFNASKLMRFSRGWRPKLT